MRTVENLIGIVKVLRGAMTDDIVGDDAYVVHAQEAQHQFFRVVYLNRDVRLRQRQCNSSC